MERIASLTVTFNRIEKLKINIKNLQNQTTKISKIYIIDNNSTDGTEEFIRGINDERIAYYKLPQNIGGSGGFSKGIEIILKDKDIDYIWGMDDDAYPKENALEEIINAMKNEGKSNCYYSNNDRDNNEFHNGIKDIKDWMFVGFFIPKLIIEKIGLPRSDFFIYHDDSEYASRIIKNNTRIIKVEKSIIVHDNNVTTENCKSKQILKWKISIPNIPNWKMYYFVRNDILKYKWNEKAKYKTIFWILPKFFIRILLVNPKQYGIAQKGYWHGIFGKTGKRV